MELIETIPRFTEALWALRYIIAIPFVTLGVLGAWSWWTGRVI